MRRFAVNDDFMNLISTIVPLSWTVRVVAKIDAKRNKKLANNGRSARPFYGASCPLLAHLRLEDMVQNNAYCGLSRSVTFSKMTNSTKYSPCYFHAQTWHERNLILQGIDPLLKPANRKKRHVRTQLILLTWFLRSACSYGLLCYLNLSRTKSGSWRLSTDRVVKFLILSLTYKSTTIGTTGARPEFQNQNDWQQQNRSQWHVCGISRPICHWLQNF